MPEVAPSFVISSYRINRVGEELGEGCARHCREYFAQAGRQAPNIPGWAVAATAVDALWLGHAIEHADQFTERESVILVSGPTGGRHRG